MYLAHRPYLFGFKKKNWYEKNRKNHWAWSLLDNKLMLTDYMNKIQGQGRNNFLKQFII